MMREILFRGKRKYNGEWVEGSLIHCDLSDGRSYTAILESDETKAHPMDWPYLCCETGCIDGYANPVNPETVGQFTGLTDKNGTKIFEGDVVQAHFRNNRSKQKFRVVFDDGMFLFDNNCVKVPKYEIYAMKVIGNIHDNPELLGVTDHA